MFTAQIASGIACVEFVLVKGVTSAVYLQVETSAVLNIVLYHIVVVSHAEAIIDAVLHMVSFYGGIIFDIDPVPAVLNFVLFHDLAGGGGVPHSFNAYRGGAFHLIVLHDIVKHGASRVPSPNEIASGTDSPIKYGETFVLDLVMGNQMVARASSQKVGP